MLSPIARGAVFLSALQNSFVVVVRADPEPGKEISLSCGHSAIGAADPNRPEHTDLFEPKRWMVRVFKEQLVLLDRSFPHLSR